MEHLDGHDLNLLTQEKLELDRVAEVRRDAILLQMEEHFIANNWQKRQCSCGRIFFAKEKNTCMECGRGECNRSEFLQRPAPKNILTAQEVSSRLSAFFEEKGYRIARAISVLSEHGNNLFVGTSGQHFDKVIHKDGSIDVQPLFVTQPVIRLQSEPLVGKIDGFTTSFVNTSTEHLQATPAQHLEHVENWFTALSKLGIYVGDLTIRLKKDDPDWGKGRFTDAVMSFYYKGLEIAYANYFIDVPQQKRDPVSISDVSFGLERLLWALNKTPSYFQGVGPTHISLDESRHKEIDSIRTAVLMTGSGVEPGHRDRSSKLRLFSKHIAHPGIEFPESLIRYYYRWWNQFSQLLHTEARVIHSMKDEWARTSNLKLQRHLTAPGDIPVEMMPDEYIRLLVKRGITLQKIKELLQSSYLPNDENS